MQTDESFIVLQTDSSYEQFNCLMRFLMKTIFFLNYWSHENKNQSVKHDQLVLKSLKYVSKPIHAMETNVKIQCFRNQFNVTLKRANNTTTFFFLLYKSKNLAFTLRNFNLRILSSDLLSKFSPISSSCRKRALKTCFRNLCNEQTIQLKRANNTTTFFLLLYKSKNLAFTLRNFMR